MAKQPIEYMESMGTKPKVEMNKKIRFALLALLMFGMINCTTEQEPIPDDCSDPPTINLTTKTDAACNQSDGSITVAGTGGAAPLMYAINGGAAQASGTFTGLAAGSYAVTVTDANNCTAELQVEVVNADGLNIELTVRGTDCGENRGQITITATGANGAVEYRLNEGAFQNSNQFLNLPQGGFTLTVRDASGCEIQQEVDIKTDVAFTDVNLIVQNNCAISGCHNGSQSPDLRTMANIINSAGRIKARTGNRSMPPGGRTLTAAEIEALACWVDDGASGN